MVDMEAPKEKLASFWSGVITLHIAPRQCRYGSNVDTFDTAGS